MPINHVSTKYNNEFRTGQDLAFLASCIGENITITTEFFYEDIIVLNNDDKIMSLHPKAGIVNTLDTSNVLWCSDSSFFDNTEVGDLISFADPFLGTDDFTDLVVTDIIDGGAIRLSGAGWALDSHHETGWIANTTKRKGLRLFYNMVVSGSTFNSLIDSEIQSLQIATADNTVLTSQALSYTGTKPYQLSNSTCLIYGLDGSANKQQKFKIEQNIRVTPLFLLAQYDELSKGLAPDGMWFGGDCLNYINKIQLLKSLNNANSTLTLSQPYIKSNIGWFNENFNGGISKYALKSLVITRLSDTTVWDDLQLNEEMEVKILISNTDLPFSSGNSKAVFGFNILPDSEEQYQRNGRTQDINFCIDSKLCVEGAGYVNGNLFGTDSQIIKKVKCDKVGDDLRITAVIEVGSDAQDIIRETTFQRYNFWCIVENHALDADLSDKTNVLCQVSKFYEQLTTIDLIDAETKFVQHSYSDFADGVDDLDAFPVDDISVQTNFSIDFTGHDNENISIQSVRNRIKLTHSSESDIILDEHIANTNNFPIIANQAQNIDFHQDRVFKVNESEKKTISITRDFASDSGNIKYYKCVFPFMHRWEYWVKLLNVTTAPTGIFDNTEPFNGLNNQWNRLANVSGWSIEYELEFEIEQNSELFSQTFTKTFTSNDFDSNTDWTDNTIKTYDPDDNTELEFSGNKIIQGYKNTKVVATFNKTTGMLPTIEDVAIVMWIETFEKGGISDIRRASSEYANFNTFFKLPVTKTNIGSQYIGTSSFDFTKLPDIRKFTVYARIYEKNGAVEDTFYIINELGEIVEDGLGNLTIYAE